MNTPCCIFETDNIIIQVKLQNDLNENHVEKLEESKFSHYINVLGPTSNDRMPAIHQAGSNWLISTKFHIFGHNNSTIISTVVRNFGTGNPKEKIESFGKFSTYGIIKTDSNGK